MRYQYNFYDLRVERIPPPQVAKTWMESTLRTLGAHVLKSLYHEYPSPIPDQKSYTLFWVIAESHAVIHTSPEDQWVEVIFGFCKPMDKKLIEKAVVEFFRPQAMRVQTLWGKPPGAKMTRETLQGLGMVERDIVKTKTPHQEIHLTQLQDGEVALYLDGAIQFVTGTDDMIYHWSLATVPARMLEGEPGSAIILGGGDGLAARNLLRFPNIKKVTMVELDPGMVEFSSQHPVMKRINMGAFQDPRLEVKVMDARQFVSSPPAEHYTLAVVDFVDPLTPSLYNLYGVPFYSRLYSHLEKPREVMSVQSSGAHSWVETAVKDNLTQVTRTKPKVVRFNGAWMGDGAIVYGGRGMKPQYANLPKEFQYTKLARTDGLGVF